MRGGSDGFWRRWWGRIRRAPWKADGPSGWAGLWGLGGGRGGSRQSSDSGIDWVPVPDGLRLRMLPRRTADLN